MNLSLLTYGAFAAAFAFGALDWLAVAREDRQGRYVFKPITMIAVLAAAALLVLYWPYDPWQVYAFILGFAFSLAGDVFLLLPSDRYFVPGLASFLLAHICYIVGLNEVLPPPTALVLAIPIGLIGWLLFTRIRAGLYRTGHQRLLAPVSIYSAVISLMLLSAWATPFKSAAGWTVARETLVILGASLFFISDTILATNRFVKRMQYGDLAVMITYHLGQIALAASLAFSG